MGEHSAGPIAPGAGSTPEDNSLGRLLTLSDGVFAIAMTLLALDLKVPDLADHVSNGQLRHALASNADTYWSYLLTFYVIASYWNRHRGLMRSVVTSHSVLIQRSLFLLFIVGAMPFLASLLGRYGSTPIALALYCAANALATLTVIVMTRDVRRLGLVDPAHAPKYEAGVQHSVVNLVVFVLCIPAAFVLGRHGPYALLGLAIPGLVSTSRRAARYRGAESSRLVSVRGELDIDDQAAKSLLSHRLTFVNSDYSVHVIEGLRDWVVKTRHTEGARMSDFFEYSLAGAGAADTPTSEAMPAGFLSGRGEREWRVLRDYSSVEIVRRGEPVVTAGERDRSLFIVLTGTFQAVLADSHPADSSARLGSVVHAGDVFGEIAFFDGLPRSSTVVAVEDARVMRIRYESIEPLSAREPALVRALLMDLGCALAGRLRATETRDGRR